AGEQDVAERHAVARVAVELLDDDLVSRGDAILLPARAHDCEHWLFSSFVEIRFPHACRRKSPGPAREACRLWQRSPTVNRATRPEPCCSAATVPANLKMTSRKCLP